MEPTQTALIVPVAEAEAAASRFRASLDQLPPGEGTTASTAVVSLIPLASTPLAAVVPLLALAVHT